MISTHLLFLGVTFSRDVNWCSICVKASLVSSHGEVSGTRPLWAQRNPEEMCLLLVNIYKSKAFTEGLQHSMKCLTHQMRVLEIPGLVLAHSPGSIAGSAAGICLTRVEMWGGRERRLHWGQKKKRLWKKLTIILVLVTKKDRQEISSVRICSQGHIPFCRLLR